MATTKKEALDAINEVVDSAPENETKGIATTPAGGFGALGLSAAALSDLGIDTEDGMGFEGIDSSDLIERIPFIKLLQLNSPEVAKSRGKLAAGTYYYKDREGNEHSAESLKVTVITIGKDRTMWPEVYAAGSSPICRSFNNKTKMEGGCGDGVCVNCQYAKFDTETRKSRCNASYILLVQLLDTGEIFRIKASGMSYGTTKEFIKKLKNTCKNFDKNLGTVPSFFFEVDLKAEMQENANGMYYVQQFDLDSIKPNNKMFANGMDADYMLFLKDFNEQYVEGIERQNEKSMESANVGLGDDEAAF